MSQNIHQQMKFADIIMLVTLSILWGGSFFFVEILVKHLPPLTIVTFRVGLAALALWGIVFALKISTPKTRQHWTALCIIGLINNALPFSLIVWGQTQISSGLASIFNATTPFFTVLVAGALLTDERITRLKLLGVLVGLLGTIVLIGPEVLKGVTGSMMGQLAVIGAAISYAFAGAFSRRFKKWGLSSLVIATGQVSMATLMLVPLMLIIDQPQLSLSAGLALPLEVIGAIIGLSFFSTVIAYVLYFRLVASAGATNAALVTFLIPISAILLGVTILGETFTSLQAVGMCLIGLGLIIMDGRLFQRLTPKA